MVKLIPSACFSPSYLRSLLPPPYCKPMQLCSIFLGCNSPFSTARLLAPFRFDTMGSGPEEASSSDFERDTWRMWRPGLLHMFSRWVRTAEVRAALQYCGGQLLVCLLVFINALSFKRACLASIFYTAVSVLLSGDHTVGARIMAGAGLIGTAWIGMLLCGTVVSLARLAPGRGYVAVLCVLTTVAFATMVPLRASAKKDVAGCGTFAIIFFGVGIIIGQTVWPAGLFWRTIVLELFADAVIAALCSIIAGCAVLPTLASRRLRATLADTILKLASSISGYAGVIVDHGSADACIAASSQPMGIAPSTLSQPHRDGRLPDPWVDRELIKRAVDPEAHRAREAVRPAYVSKAAALRPLLQQVRASAVQAGFEPPFLHTSRLAGWRGVGEAAETLLSRVACLESVVESATGEGRLERLQILERQTGTHVMDSLALVFAKLAASCACLAASIRDCDDVAKAKTRLNIFGESWGATEAALAKGLHDSSVKAIRSLTWDYKEGSVVYRHMPEVRGLYYVCTLAGGIMEAVTHLERAVAAALKSRCLRPRRTRRCSKRGASPPEWSTVAAALQPPVLSGNCQAAMSVGSTAYNEVYMPKSRRAQASLADGSRSGDSTGAAAAIGMQPRGSFDLEDRTRAAVKHSDRTDYQIDRDGSSSDGSSSSSTITSSSSSSSKSNDSSCHSADSHSHCTKRTQFKEPRSTKLRQKAACARNRSNGSCQTEPDAGSSVLTEHGPGCRQAPTLTSSRQLARGDPASSSRAFESREHGGDPLTCENLPGSMRHSADTYTTSDLGMGSDQEGDSPDANGMWSPQGSFIKSTDSLEGMSLRPLQNLPMGDFIIRSRSHASALNEADELSDRSEASIPTGSGATRSDSDMPGTTAAGVTSADENGERAAERRLKFRRPKARRRGKQHRQHSFDHDDVISTTHPGKLADGLRRYGAYIWPILLGMLGITAIRAWFDMATTTLPQICRQPGQLLGAFRTDRHLQFGIKLFCGLGGALILIILLQETVPVLRGWGLLYAFFTFSVGFNEKVEATASKAVLRITTTALGGGLGLATMLQSRVATNPYVLTVIILVLNLCAALFMLSHFKYAVFLTISAFNGMVLCQYGPCTDLAACTTTGRVRVYYTLTAAVGVALVALLAINLIMPWYSSESAVDLLGTIFEEATELVQHHFDAARWEMARPAGKAALRKASQGGAQPLDTGWLQARIVGPLTSVQATVQDETVVWRSGFLVLPRYIHLLLDAALLLTDRLEAMQLVLSAKPIVSGRYSAATWQHMMLPMEQSMRESVEAAGNVGRAVASFLQQREGSSEGAIRETIKVLEDHRMKVRIVQSNMMASFFTAIYPSDAPPLRADTDARLQGRPSLLPASSTMPAATDSRAAPPSLTPKHKSTTASSPASWPIASTIMDGGGSVPSLSASATGSSQPVDVSAETAATSDDLDGKAQHRPGARFRVPDQKGAGSYPTETGATHEYETPHSNADEKTAAGNDVGGWHANSEDQGGGALSGRTPDDMCRFGSYNFTVTEQMDKLTLFANIALEHASEIKARRH